MSHIWMSHSTHMNKPCLTCEWVMTHRCKSQVKYSVFKNMREFIHEACHTYGWVIAHIWINHVTHANESCHTYKRVMSYPHICKESCDISISGSMREFRESHVICIDESRHARECVMAHIWMSHVTHRNASCYTYGWVMWHVWHMTHTHISI